MSSASILRRQLAWVLGALVLGAALLIVAAYRITLAEIDEILDDGLRQTALLLADRDLVHMPAGSAVDFGAAQTESKMVAFGRRPNGDLLFTSQPELSLAFRVAPGASVQSAGGLSWHVFTVVQSDRIIQVAQPDAVRSESAVEAASQMLLPMALLTLLIAVLLLAALRRGLKPLQATSAALAQRGEGSLSPLDLGGVPAELVPLVRTLNDLLRRLAAALEAQRRFVADAAHELRSPMAAVQLQAQLLEGSSDPAQRRQAGQELAAGIARANRLVRQLLQLSRASADGEGGLAAARAAVPLGDIVRAAVARWAPEAERRGVDLGAEVRDECTIEGDAVQLDILLGNLVENALHHTPRGGVVDVVLSRNANVPVLQVVDSGCGIAAADRERVFDRFYRGRDAAARAESGSGLGLAIVRAVADAHHAVVSLHDRPGGPGLAVRVAFAPAEVVRAHQAA
jgi:signal transduction histidine kinase